MKRDIDNVLLTWKNDPQRRPLLVRGARQVGKSYSITQFGQKEFSNLTIINFEQRPEFKTCFNTLNPKEIIGTISLLSKNDITPGKTLLFLDEIQECPKAITALRYFYEQMPELHVIAAGSLLEFTLAQENFRMPVGRIQYLYMKPLSFCEFLDAAGEHNARELIENITWENLPNETIHQYLVTLVKKYAIVGGMPSAVAEYISSGNLGRCHQIQTIIIQTYRDDFGKYAGKTKYNYLQKIFYAAPKMVGKKFKYSQVDDSIQSRDLKEALELLERAGVVYRVKQTSGEGLPLEANANERHFKVVFLDTGLMQNICGLTSETIMMEDFIQVNSGAVAEQFTAQELMAYQDVYRDTSLYYWAREERSSNAEVDYLVPYSGYAFPIEVKAGKTGTLRSMHLFLGKYPAPVGIRVSQQPFSKNPPVISVPFYGITVIPHLLRNYLAKKE
ncbi:MAG TPA: AAA family ATPase [Candidatus Deferrimicrobium sp.]|nr:AAA family ATPase [Candidatus Deferrimicrobium sp.]